MGEGGALRELLTATGGLQLLPQAGQPAPGWRRLSLDLGVCLAVPDGLDNRALVAVKDQVRGLLAADRRVRALEQENRMLTGQVDALLHVLDTGQADESRIPALFAFLPPGSGYAVMKDGDLLTGRDIDEHSLRIESQRMERRTEHACDIATGQRLVYRCDRYVAIVDSARPLDQVHRQLVRLSLSQLAAHRVQREQHEMIERVRALVGVQAGAATPGDHGVVEQYVSKLMDATVRDSLTRVYNRNKITDVVAELHAGRRPFSIVLADIDHFKSVNDTFGHLAGDRVIVEVAACLQAGSRGDDVVARWGGEEFISVLPETDQDRARATAERWRLRIADTISVEGRGVTCSFGVATHSSELTDEELFHRADTALYQAKRGGRNRVEVYAPCADHGRGPGPAGVVEPGWRLMAGDGEIEDRVCGSADVGARAGPPS